MMCCVSPVEKVRTRYQVAEASSWQTSRTSDTKKMGGILIAKLADLVEFAIRFDTLKASRPELQNDLSYFRRLVAVHTPSNQLERYPTLLYT